MLLKDKTKCCWVIERSEIIDPDYPKAKRSYTLQCEYPPKFIMDGKLVCGIHKNVWFRFNERMGRTSKIEVISKKENK